MVYIIMTGKGQHGKTTDNMPVRFYDNEAAAIEHLEGLRRTCNRPGTAHITTKGRGYFTYKYEWPILGAELRHTYWIERHPVYSKC